MELLLLEYGAEGGGAKVFQLPGNTVVERGSSGGILDDEEDPVTKWEKEFDSFDAWWQDFLGGYGYKWVYFYPVFIHPSLHVHVLKALQHTDLKKPELDYHKTKWLQKIQFVLK